MHVILLLFSLHNFLMIHRYVYVMTLISYEKGHYYMHDIFTMREKKTPLKYSINDIMD